MNEAPPAQEGSVRTESGFSLHTTHHISAVSLLLHNFSELVLHSEEKLRSTALRVISWVACICMGEL